MGISIVLASSCWLVPIGSCPTKRYRRGSYRHLIMPEVFRLLYGCGFRLSEVLHLRVADVHLNRGILTVRQGKFGKDRLVPPTLALVVRLQKYAAGYKARPPDAFFFPSHHDGPWSIRTVYHLFRELLLQCGIPHAGRSKGPRVHDVRHYSGTRIIPATDGQMMYFPGDRVIADA